jgi:multicomponent Na+:H+ antiporter subunit C
MVQGLITNYYEVVAVIVFGIGLATMLLDKNIIKKIIGFNFMDTAVDLFLASKGYIAGRVAPIALSLAETPKTSDYINLIPAGLVLTSIVVSVSFSAFSLALAVRLYRAYGTLNLDEIIHKMHKDQEVY